jgi:hypothetical protein
MLEMRLRRDELPDSIALDDFSVLGQLPTLDTLPRDAGPRRCARDRYAVAPRARGGSGLVRVRGEQGGSGRQAGRPCVRLPVLSGTGTPSRRLGRTTACAASVRRPRTRGNGLGTGTGGVCAAVASCDAAAWKRGRRQAKSAASAGRAFRRGVDSHATRAICPMIGAVHGMTIRMHRCRSTSSADAAMNSASHRLRRSTHSSRVSIRE